MPSRQRKFPSLALGILAVVSLLTAIVLVQGEQVTSAFSDTLWCAPVAGCSALIFLVSSFAMYCTWFDDLGFDATDSTPSGS